MAYKDLETGRSRDRARYNKRVAARHAVGLCPRCGKVPPEPGRSRCDPCAEKHRIAGRARDARLRAAGIQRRDPIRAKASERDRARRRTLYGATPERGEFDPREVWDQDDALAAMGEAFRILSTGVTPRRHPTRR